MDRIVKSLVEDLLNSLELKSESQDIDFEKFANYCIISKEYNKSFDLETSLTGTGDDTGIDGIAIIVNGQVIENTEDIDFLLENNNYLEATLIFIQAKTSPEFSSKEMNNFAYGVKDFFAEDHKLRRNQEISDLAEISNYLFDKASKFRHNPKLKLYYISNGNWTGDQNNVAIIDSNKNELIETNLFDSVTFEPIGAADIAKIYRATKNSISATFNFVGKVTLPDLKDVTESYFGILPLSEFKKILIDDNDNLKNIFYDNVRDFQGIDNPVNSGITETLNGNEKELFTILNNGVTIVADKIKTSGNKFTIWDYQIVNGCQTSNVLYEYIKGNDENDINLPIKLVVTNNDDVKNRITIATNSQTAIKREQLQAMTDFQKNLEYYFQTFEGDGRLFYERRSGQYQTDGTVIKARIINIKDLIKSFSSIYYENPDRVTTYFGSIVKQNVESDNPIIFNSSHRNIIYYTAALAFYRLETFFKSRAIDTNYRKARFFLLMLFRMIVSPEKLEITYMSSDRKTVQYCNPVIDCLKDIDKSKSVFEEAIEIFKLSGLDVNDKQLIKQTSFTKDLKEAYYVFKDLNK